MTAEERAESERRLLLQAERHAALVERMREAQRRAEALAQSICNARLKRERQPQLDFAI